MKNPLVKHDCRDINFKKRWIIIAVLIHIQLDEV